MSFIDIKDPTKRDEIVADYVATIHRVQQRNEDEKSVGLAKRAELERTFNPIVKATQQSTKSIKESLNPIHEELKTVSKNLKKEPPQPRAKRIWSAETGQSPIEFYQDKNLDKYFAMREEDGDLVLGDQVVTVDEDFNITAKGETYAGTSGLWSLIMLTTPPPSSYTPDDEQEYKKLAEQTNILDNHQHVEGGRPKATFKWKMLQEKGSGVVPSYHPYHPFWARYIQNYDGRFPSEDGTYGRFPNEDGTFSGTVVSASGIFLPGDIKGLKDKLSLLLAEFRAGNTTTRNQIVYILDELLRRKRMSRKEYTSINNYLSNARNPGQTSSTT